MLRRAIWIIVPLSVSSCAPVMEVTRPDPVDIHQFVVGEDRLKVMAEIGAPVTSVPSNGQSCDIYKLYTHGPGAIGKGAIAAGEAIADVFTLGLSEVAETAAEAATRNSKHTVLFCHTSENKLASVQESESHVDD